MLPCSLLMILSHNIIIIVQVRKFLTSYKIQELVYLPPIIINELLTICKTAVDTLRPIQNILVIYVFLFIIFCCKRFILYITCTI